MGWPMLMLPNGQLSGTTKVKCAVHRMQCYSRSNATTACTPAVAPTKSLLALIVR